MSALAVSAALPSSALFRFPPASLPTFITPPLAGSASFAPPIDIPQHIYRGVLDARVPITIAALYAVTAKALNLYNRSTGRRPWAISKTRPFFAFVVLHNVLLAVYSAWTFVGMFGALRRSFVSPFASAVDSTGSVSTGGWAATADSACRLLGAPGLGNGLNFNEAAGRWQASSASFDATAFTVPDSLQPGRLWNEGLAFYGWIFYLSKFYEVLDTFIILAKGKFSSTLQTYHHAGAMMCMWAGMRFMSAPIWVFVFVNSGIHALMYTYYTITAFSIRVPTAIKRSLTTMQIMQFVFGASYAMLHPFVSYTVPVVVGTAPDSAESAAPSPVQGSIQGSIQGSVKSFFSGAETVDAANASSALLDTAHSVQYEFRTVPCITSTSETFAIWLNVLYLAPLTYLFVSFFISSYVRRSHAESARAARLGKADGGLTAAAASLSPHGASSATTTIASTLATASAAEELVRRRLSNVSNLAEKAGWDAARDLEKEVYGESRESDEAVVEADDDLQPAQTLAPPPVHGAVPSPTKRKTRSKKL